MITVQKHMDFTRAGAYAGRLKRAHADVVLIGSGSQTSLPYKALVDTGADYLQLPRSAASQSQIQIKGITIPVKLAAGSTQMILMSNLSVEIEGIKVKTDVLFPPQLPGRVQIPARALLGRLALFKLIEFGFDINAWYAK